MATGLQVRGVGLDAWSTALPRAAECLDMRYQRISRLPGIGPIGVDAATTPFARAIPAAG